VVSAIDGEAALVTARELFPNLIRLDMWLTKPGGLGVLRALKHDPRTAVIPVIVLTALGAMNESKLKKERATARFHKIGCVLYRTISDALLHVVENVLGKQETERPLAEISAASESLAVTALSYCAGLCKLS
jgi:CheY-like chemotaxis protein